MTDFLICPVCRADLEQASDAKLRCNSCIVVYEVRSGIPILLPEIREDIKRRYFDNYERIAEADLANPLEVLRRARHARLLEFIGNVSQSRVLDIGSSNALLLRQIDAQLKVAFDIAFPYLERIPPSAGITAVCGDAEQLPFRAGFFDVIVISDVLEHVLDPQLVVNALARIVTPTTRVIVEVPWEEDLASYQASDWEFSHLRSFDLFSFSTLWSRFRIARMRSAVPRLEVPLFLQGRLPLPLPLLNRLRVLYHHHDLGERDFQWRSRRLRMLPRSDRILTAFSRPLVRQFDLRLMPPEAIHKPHGWLDRIVARSANFALRDKAWTRR